MKALLAMLFLCLGTHSALAANDQREDCNQKAQGYSGSERSRIISACIKHNAAIDVMPPMLAKMTACNEKAGNMEGQKRIDFVDRCLGEP